MWQQFWRKWTIDKPAAFGDWLWDVFVVQFAAFLNTLTWRKVIALIPIGILIIAYTHEIPVSPALMLAGDLLAYIDVFSVLFVLGILSRVTTILYLVKQAASYASRLVGSLRVMLQRRDVRHGRQGGAQNRRRPGNRARNDDDDPAAIHGVAWA